MAHLYYPTTDPVVFSYSISLVYLMPESVVPKLKMKKWALTVSLIFLAWQLLTPFLFFFTEHNKKAALFGESRFGLF
ncbi:hypothetical protein [Enterococcus sp.]|uniref:hypothetical protein n=2 Tax=Enterococcus sp. TaxID=35783 RepID=UPI0028A9AB8A|nr:hypothetical protein [Enterococcus sp.]